MEFDECEYEEFCWQNLVEANCGGVPTSDESRELGADAGK